MAARQRYEGMAFGPAQVDRRPEDQRYAEYQEDVAAAGVWYANHHVARPSDGYEAKGYDSASGASWELIRVAIVLALQYANYGMAEGGRPVGGTGGYRRPVELAELRWTQTTAGGRGRAAEYREVMATKGWIGQIWTSSARPTVS